MIQSKPSAHTYNVNQKHLNQLVHQMIATLDPTTTSKLHAYLRIWRNLAKLREAAKYLVRCQRNEIMPNFISRKTHFWNPNGKQKKKWLIKFEMSWLQNEIAGKKKAIKDTFTNIRTLERQLLPHIPLNTISSFNSHSKRLYMEEKRKWTTHFVNKFNNLLPRRTPPVTTQAPDKEKITILGNVTLNESTKTLLSRGPKFTPITPGPDIALIRKVSAGYISLALNLRSDLLRDKNNGLNTLVDQLPPIPFVRTRCWIPPSIEETDRKITAALTLCQRAIPLPKRKPNLSRGEIQALKDLAKDKTIVCSISDKGGEFVVADADFHLTAMHHHLEDSSTYKKITKKEYLLELNRLNAQVDKVLDKWDEKTAERLRDLHPTVNTFYGLFKTHKFKERGQAADPTEVKVRPIISGSGGPTDRPSWVVCTILSQLLQFVPCHLSNTANLLTDLNQVTTTPSVRYESFDVESLYTNIDNAAALDAVLCSLTKNSSSLNWHGVTRRDLTILLEACLNFNSFQFNGQLYSQIRGLAMGSRLAPVLAVIYMDQIESPSKGVPHVYFKRYIDDFLVLADTQESIDKMFTCLNAQSQNIRVTREKPDSITGWLPFLNLELKYNNGILETRWYRKPANRNLLVPQDSHHPKIQKRNVVTTTTRTALQVSTVDQKQYSLNLAKSILEENGYTRFQSTATHRTHYHCTKWMNTQRTSADRRTILNIPFISDEFTRIARNSLYHTGVNATVVEQKGRSLQQILVKNRRFDTRCERRSCRVCPTLGPGKCCIKGGIYRITCDCGKSYIGESGRPLAERINEHYRAAEKPHTPSYKSTVWSKHSMEVHKGGPLSLQLELLDIERNTWKRRILEGTFIKMEKPELNTKEELTDMVANLGCLKLT